MEKELGAPVLETKEEKGMRIAAAMREQTEREPSEHHRFVMDGMLAKFEAAVASPEDTELRADAVKSLDMGDNYLGERYRDTREERAYLQAINEAAAYLRSL